MSDSPIFVCFRFAKNDSGLREEPHVHPKPIQKQGVVVVASLALLLCLPETNSAQEPDTLKTQAKESRKEEAPKEIDTKERIDKALRSAQRLSREGRDFEAEELLAQEAKTIAAQDKFMALKLWEKIALLQGRSKRVEAKRATLEYILTLAKDDVGKTLQHRSGLATTLQQLGYRDLAVKTARESIELLKKESIPSDHSWSIGVHYSLSLIHISEPTRQEESRMPSSA